ncbi:MAG: hypothetical protein QM784_11555 [Polyangiaceae bacterium]
MNRWIQVFGMLALMGCTATRELAESNNDTALTGDEDAQKTPELAAACAAIEATFADDSPSMPTASSENRSDFYQVYCEDPSWYAPIADQMPTVYCAQIQKQVPAYCLQVGIPLLKCVTEKETTVVSEDCADVWLGPDCDPTTKRILPEFPASAPDGLNAICVGGLIGGTPSGLEIILPRENDETCSDGHRYHVTCAVGSDCAMNCDCWLDSVKVSTVHAPFMGNNAALAACGWKP